MSKKDTVIHVNVEDRDRLEKLRQMKMENLAEVFTRAVDALEREMTEVFEQEPKQEPVEAICEECGRGFESELALSKHQAWSKKLGVCRT